MHLTETSMRMMRASGALDMACYEGSGNRRGWRRALRRGARRAAFVAAGLAAAAAVGAALLFWAQAAEAQGASCGHRQTVVEQLRAGFDEVPTASGVTASGYMAEVFLSPDGATWTIVVTRPDGISCAIAAGHTWEQRDVPKAEGEGL